MDNIRIADLSGLDPAVRDVMLSGRIKALLPVSLIEEHGERKMHC